MFGCFTRHMRTTNCLNLLVSVAAGFLAACLPLSAAGYDPLALPNAAGEIKTVDLSVKDEKRGREIPLRVYLPPSAKGAQKVVLFSHGLGGSRENSPYLGNHWAGRGYVVVFMQHAGSDASVWKGAPLAQRMDAMKSAASLGNFMDRVQDVPAVLNQLEKWNKEQGHALSGRMELEKVGMCGHSFGAVTTQAVSGQSFLQGGQRFTDPRIDAAIAYSPSAPKVGDPAKAFGSVKIPWMLMTGTQDTSPIGDISVEARLKVYPALPKGLAYELVLDGAEHSAFSDRALPGDKQSRNPNHHKLVLALSTAFWDAHLRDDKDARKWLEGEGAKSLLEKGDRWQWK